MCSDVRTVMTAPDKHMVTAGHSGAVTGLASALASHMLVSCSGDGCVCLWDSRMSKNVGWALSDNAMLSYSSIALSRDCNTLAVAAGITQPSSLLRIWSEPPLAARCSAEH